MSVERLEEPPAGIRGAADRDQQHRRQHDVQRHQPPQRRRRRRTSFQVGITSSLTDQVSVSFGNADVSHLGLSVIDVSTAADATAALATIQTAIQNLSTIRAGFGAGMDALQDTVSNLGSMTTNTSAALSTIQDVDVASATAQLSQQQVMSQAGEAILAQANQMPQLAVSLIHNQ